MRFLIAFIFVGSTVFADENTSVSSAKISDQGEAVSRLKLNPEALTAFGSTSNATLLNDPTPGTFAKVKPSLTADWNASDQMILTGTVDAQLKRFSDSNVSSLANETRVGAKTDLNWYLSDVWEIGTNLSASYFDGHIPVVGATSVQAIPQTYFQPEARMYVAWTGDEWSTEFGVDGTNRNYSTTTFDIQGNTYKNTYDEYKLDGRLGYRWSKDTNLKFKSTAERRQYQERMAEFSDGLPAYPGSPNPILTTTASDNELSYKSRIYSVPFTSALSGRFEKDLIYGARDSFRWKLKEKASVPIFWKFAFDPEISVSKQIFSNFRSDPVNDPANSPLRVDWETQLSGLLKFPLSQKLIAQAQYTLNRKASNYILENYVEQVVETGFNVQF